MSVVDDPARGQLCSPCLELRHLEKAAGRVVILLDVPSEERKVQSHSHPVSVDEEEEGQEDMNGRFRDDVCV